MAYRYSHTLCHTRPFPLEHGQAGLLPLVAPLQRLLFSVLDKSICWCFSLYWHPRHIEEEWQWVHWPALALRCRILSNSPLQHTDRGMGWAAGGYLCLVLFPPGHWDPWLLDQTTPTVVLLHSTLVATHPHYGVTAEGSQVCSTPWFRSFSF